MKDKNLIKLREYGFNVPEFEIIEWEDRNKKIDLSKYKGKYAIRSSSNLEDSSDNSFAGLFDTYLNVDSKDIESKVKECFNSINNKNVKEYITNKNIDISDVKMNVIIHKMVNSKNSGILFTSNPQGLLNESVIVVGRGLGNNVVEDKVDTTTYYFNNTDSIYYYEGDCDYLDNDMINNLISISKDLKKYFGEYIDIEFAIENDDIYILYRDT